MPKKSDLRNPLPAMERAAMGFGEGQQIRSNTPTRCDPISPYFLWIGCYGKHNIRLIVRIIRGYSKHRVNDAIETLHGLIITQE